MSSPKIGIWFIGAWGGVATTAAVGLAALQKKLTGETALVTALPQFAKLDLAEWNDFTVGGHEIRDTNYDTEARVLLDQSHVFSDSLLKDISDTLASFDKNIKKGTLYNVGDTIRSLASDDVKNQKIESALQVINDLKSDFENFKKENKLDRVIVVNLSSTEPPVEGNPLPESWAALEKLLIEKECVPIAASSLYAIAAIQTGCAFVNFTPSVGTNLPAICELAEQENVLHAGRDGKTGETLMKSVLAPMFAQRNLKVQSWVGHNIFGNMDGKVLDDPANKESKVKSKDHLLTDILGYKPQSLVTIEYIESLGDWKTAWDHIHFDGFLDTRMTLQFTWQGCDSLLAAPLALDLVRLTEREQREGTGGIMSHLSSFFKSPMGTDEPEFVRQFLILEEWVKSRS